MRCSPGFLLLAAFLSPIGAYGETGEGALTRAAAAVQAATPQAQADPAHPIFHVTAPAQWINDPNGPIFHNGYYHLFYQLHPYSDKDGTKYWGHVRSRDLAKWEHLPIALAPLNDRGEEAVWSGCCTLNRARQPMIFYTSIAIGKSAFDHAEQWAAVGDTDLIRWQRSTANPVLSEALHGDKKIYDWRDPFVFHEAGRTFLVTGGHIARQGEAAVNIYEAQNRELTQWRYQGVLFKIPDAPTAECPNFFRLGNQWVLFVSPYGKVQYFIGDFDLKSCRFTQRKQGLVDYGPNFYAPNTMLLDNGNRITWGWINGFPGGHGWNGCLSLPRRLSIDPDGELRQRPAPELAALRGPQAAWRNLALADSAQRLSLPGAGSLEILLNLDFGNAKALVIELKPRAAESSPVTIHCGPEGLTVGKETAPARWLRGHGKNGELRIFVDRSVLEVVANEKEWVTKTISPLAADSELLVRSEGGRATLKLAKAWPMRTIW
ncbi:MAG TPA: glycoside hydrolase family 32 protein [Verrucomicrobiae bacterium]|nr:glycoside hydrolase family 32 protein [Verrucomicrobiae bacterium]